jgi:hypothetical protein
MMLSFFCRDLRVGTRGIKGEKAGENQLFLKGGKKTCINHVSTVLEALFPLLRDEGCTYNNQ